MTKARITLSGVNPTDLDGVVGQIRELATALNMKFHGPVRLPRKKLEITTRRTPCGDGSDTYEHWEKRVSKRLVDIDGDEKYIKQILRVKVPPDVFVKINLS
ncbi:MAG: 30S ribosomal protein S10 [Candidatus Micrarchaeota archaeon]|nr:30S ribosomal protein S10 [Candidatus Micrarchaeota archaeon]